MRKSLRAMFLSVAVLTAACDAVPPSLPEADRQADPLAAVGRGLALALQETDVRRFVIAEMRGSPWVEHKVSLHELVAKQGSPLRRQAAVRLGMSEDAFSGLVGRLPEMDFYLTGGVQRRSWTENGPSASVAVSADHRHFVEYDATGTGTASSRPVGQVVFALHPAERQAYRIGRPEATAPGAVIEDAGDGAGGLLVTLTDRFGEPVVLDVGRERMTPEGVRAYLGLMRGAAAPAAEGGGSQASFLAPGTRLAHFANGWVTDGFGSAEIEIKVWQTTSSGTTRNRVQFRWEGVDPGHLMVGDCFQLAAHPNCIQAPLSLWATSWYPGLESTYLRARAEMMETDTGADDSYGSRYWYWADNGAFRNYDNIGQCWDPGGYPAVCGTATLEWN